MFRPAPEQKVKIFTNHELNEMQPAKLTASFLIFRINRELNEKKFEYYKFHNLTDL